MIPEWIDLRSAIIGALVAYSIAILFTVLWCWLCNYVERRHAQQRRIDRIWLGVRTSIVADRFIKIRDPERFIRTVDHPAHPWKQN